jgi:hypothetical protein
VLGPFVASLANRGLQLGARIFFLLLTAMGSWLTYVGWTPHSTDAKRTAACG